MRLGAWTGAWLAVAAAWIAACSPSPIENARATPEDPTRGLAATVQAQATEIAALRRPPTPSAEIPRLAATISAQATQIAGLAAKAAGPGPISELVLVNRRAANLAQQSTALIELRNSSGVLYGLGSGIVLSDDGLIMTNWHVARQVPALSVTVPGRARARATLIASNPDLDLAILKADLAGLTPAAMASSDDLDPGDPVLAVGYGLGEEIGTESASVTVGVVSAFRQFPIGPNQLERRVIQMTAPVNEGNSGGPLVNHRGEVVGIVTKGGNPAKVQSVNFAVPIEDAAPLIQEARAQVDRTAVGRPAGEAGRAPQVEILDLVRRYYVAIGRGDHAAAHDLWTAEARRRLDRDAFARQFADLVRIYLDDFEILTLEAATATIRVETTTVNRVPAGRVAQRARLTWTLERGPDGWRRAAVVDQPIGAAQPLRGPDETPRRGKVDSEFYQQFLLGRQEFALKILDADLTNDVGVETIVVAAGTGCGSCRGQVVYVFRGRDLLFELAAADPAVEPLPTADGFTISEPERAPNRSRTFVWTGTAFRPLNGAAAGGESGR